MFWFPVWDSIHQQDNERYEDLDLANEIEKYLIKWYTMYNYTLIEVPKTSIQGRVDFIISNL